MAEQAGPTERIVNGAVSTVETVGDAAFDVLTTTKDAATHTIDAVADDLLDNARQAYAHYLEALRKAANAILPG